MNLYWMYTGASPGGFTWTGGDTVHRDTGTKVEAVIGEPNFKNIWWMEKAIQASQQVARVKLPGGSATCFLISTDIIMTNNHVLENKQDAKNAIIQFNYRLTPDGSPAQVDEWECDPHSLFKTNPQLDYSIVKLKKKNNHTAGEKWGFFQPRHGQNVYLNQRVNIIQHPGGRYMEIAFRDNQIRDIQDQYVQYITDTDYGSSGSPVLDDWFNVLALHNQRVRDPNDPYRWYRNQGFRIEAILQDAVDLIP